MIAVRASSATVAYFAFVSVLGAACDEAKTGFCGSSGSLVTAADAARYCVYDGLSMERGGRLACPPGLTFKLQSGDVVICSERAATAESLPPEVCAEVTIEACGTGFDAGSDGDAGAADAEVPMDGAVDLGPADAGPSEAGGDAAVGPGSCGGRAICGIAAGRGHTCVLFATGRVYCWGRGSEGQIGVGGKDATYRSPVPASELDDAIAITAGWYFSCALRADGSVACWGENAAGQLGTGDEDPRPRPTVVPGLGGVVQLVAGASHVCARTAGSIRCWGDNRRGRLGNGTDVNATLPTEVVGLSPGARWVAPGDQHTCAAAADGDAFCWGANAFGTLGDDSGFEGERLTPVPVVAIGDVLRLSSGDATCALVAGMPQTVSCWGNNSAGQIGNAPGGYFDIPSDVAIDGAEPVAIATRDQRACAVLDDGSVVCWGNDPRGDGDPAPTGTPTLVPALAGVVDITLGHEHGCALTATDEVLCWGSNAYGQLGTGPSDTDPAGHLTPVAVPDLL